MLDAAALAQVLVASKKASRDIGAMAVLREYEKMRRQNNLLMMTTMDLFYRVFGNAQLPLKLLRNVGLGFAERLSPAKKLAMKYAMGLGGQFPRLARGEAIVR